MQVVGAPDAELEHPPAPDRRAERERHVVRAPRQQVPAHPPDLDVDNAPRPELQALAGVLGRVNRLV